MWKLLDGGRRVESARFAQAVADRPQACPALQGAGSGGWLVVRVRPSIDLVMLLPDLNHIALICPRHFFQPASAGGRPRSRIIAHKPERFCAVVHDDAWKPRTGHIHDDHFFLNMAWHVAAERSNPDLVIKNTFLYDCFKFMCIVSGVPGDLLYDETIIHY